MLALEILRPMKEVAVISYGMSDMIIPQLKNLAVSVKDVRVTLFLIYGQNRKKEGIINFESMPVVNGFLPDEQVEKILGEAIRSYIDDAFAVRVFIYDKLRFRSLKNWRLSLQLVATLRKFDLIHINGVCGTLLQLIPFLAFRNWVKTVHDFAPHSGEGSTAAEKMMNFILNRAPLIIIQNGEDYERMKDSHPKWFKKTTLIPFGYLDVYKHFTPENMEDEASCDILFFGRISKYKGLEYLLAAIELLKEKNLNPKVVIAGSGNYDFGIARLKEDNNIRFLNGYVENSALAGLISRAKLVVCPYTDATQSGVLMTAFAFAKPAVATDVGGFRNVIINGVNGFLVPPKQPVALASALASLLNDPELRQEMAQNIREYKGLGHYKWEVIAQQLYTVYKRLL